MIGWELKVTMVFIILKSRHFDPFLHVKQTLYPVLTDVPTSQRGESPGICGFSDHLASFHWAWQKAWWLASTYGNLFFWHTNSGRWWLLGPPQQLGSSLLLPGLALGVWPGAGVSGAAGLCFPQKTAGGTVSFSVSSSGKQTPEFSSRFQPACPWLGSGEGAADVRNGQYFTFYQNKNYLFRVAEFWR